MSRTALLALTAIFALLAACASRAPAPQAAPASAPAASPAPAPEAKAPGAPHYRCDHDIEFTVRFDDGSAVLDAGTRGTDTLLRDAGGVTPSESVYSSTNMKAEFGLGGDGREAKLNYASPPLEAHCVRD